MCAGVCVYARACAYAWVRVCAKVHAHVQIRAHALVRTDDFLSATHTVLEIDSLKDTSCGACCLCTQMIVERCATPVVLEVDSLEDTSRGAAGFGSTGQ